LKVREISNRHDVVVNHSTQFTQFLVRQFQKLLEQAKLVHQLECGWMNGVAAEIAKEIGMFF
jgi:hypothetical protein